MSSIHPYVCAGCGKTLVTCQEEGYACHNDLLVWRELSDDELVRSKKTYTPGCRAAEYT